MHLSNDWSLMVTSRVTSRGIKLSSWFLPLLLLFIHASQAEILDDSYSPLGAHGGIFRELPWTKAELLEISSLHAKAEYDSLITLIKNKLVDSQDELRPETRRRIEKFLKAKRPPTVIRTFLTEKERNQIRQLHANEDVDGVLNIIREAIFRLPAHFQNEALRYLSPPNAPKAIHKHLPY